MLVGSLNAANKFTIGRGKMQKLSGLIITKNIEPAKQKMPSKVNITQRKPRVWLCSAQLVSNYFAFLRLSSIL